MTGLQLREQMRALRPNIKFLLISGYAEDIIEGSPQQELNGIEFLEKPFLPEEFARKVRQILGQSERLRNELLGRAESSGIPENKFGGSANCR